MYQTRQATSTKIPIPRKGTKYVARAASHHKESVPVVIAVRDLLGLARTSKEVKRMVAQGLLEINGKKVKDIKESIKLLNLFKADKAYTLGLTNNGKFSLQETKDDKQRIVKVTNKALVKSGKVQLNFHDGTNLLSSEKVNTHDSVSLDLKGKFKKKIPLDKGSKVLIFSGKYSGKEAKVLSIDEDKATLKLDDKETQLNKKQLIAI